MSTPWICRSASTALDPHLDEHDVALTERWGVVGWGGILRPDDNVLDTTLSTHVGR